MEASNLFIKSLTSSEQLSVIKRGSEKRRGTLKDSTEKCNINKIRLKKYKYGKLE